MGDLIFKWAWRHYSLRITEHPDLADALWAAYNASEEGDESLVHIEVFHDNGESERLDLTDVHRLLKPEIDAKESEYRAAPDPVARIEVDGPKGNATLGWYATEVDAVRDYDRLRARLGDRVSLKLLTPATSRSS